MEQQIKEWLSSQNLGPIFPTILESASSFFASSNIPNPSKHDIDLFLNVWSFAHKNTLDHGMADTLFTLRDGYLHMKKKFGSSNDEVSRLVREKALLLQTISNMEDEQAQLDSSQAQLSSSKAQLDFSQAQLSSLQSQLSSSKAQLETSQAQLSSLQSQLEISQSHLSSSQAQIDSSQAQLEVSQAQLDSSQSQLKLSQTQILSLQAQISSLQSQLELSQTNMAEKNKIIEALQKDKSALSSVTSSLCAPSPSPFPNTISSSSSSSSNVVSSNTDNIIFLLGSYDKILDRKKLVISTLVSMNIPYIDVDNIDLTCSINYTHLLTHGYLRTHLKMAFTSLCDKFIVDDSWIDECIKIGNKFAPIQSHCWHANYRNPLKDKKIFITPTLKNDKPTWTVLSNFITAAKAIITENSDNADQIVGLEQDDKDSDVYKTADPYALFFTFVQFIGQIPIPCEPKRKQRPPSSSSTKISVSLPPKKIQKQHE
jgi:peptidoglycan hydrolase CwlO-like protein